MTNLATQIKHALEQAEKAHHEYEESELNGLRDNNWARWYAAYLTANNCIFAGITDEVMEKQLVKSTANKEQEAAHMDWTEYTTQNIIDNLSDMFQ